MKGLLLKDFYLMRKYCRAYLLFILIFIAVAHVGGASLFFVFYPCIFSSMIPITLLSYDERSKWSEYCGTLPYTKTQIVSAKYLMGIFAQLFVLVLSGISQAVRMNMDGTFVLSDYLMLMAILLILSCAATSIVLPFMFKMGVEKGRIAYFVMIGILSAGSIAAAGCFSNFNTILTPIGILIIICGAAVAIYALSWYLSIVFYKKRETK